MSIFLGINNFAFWKHEGVFIVCFLVAIIRCCPLAAVLLSLIVPITLQGFIIGGPQQWITGVPQVWPICWIWQDLRCQRSWDVCLLSMSLVKFLHYIIRMHNGKRLECTGLCCSFSQCLLGMPCVRIPLGDIGWWSQQTITNPTLVKSASWTILKFTPLLMLPP